MKKILLLYTSIGLYFCAYAQNHVFENAEMVNFRTIDIATVINDNDWTTARNEIPGKYSNFGSAAFKYHDTFLTLDSHPDKWIKGYVKHYATEGNIRHLYPVGGDSEIRFMQTESEIVSESIAVAWIDGDPSFNADPTPPEIGLHNKGSIEGFDKLIDLGMWDWVATYQEGNVKVIVKLPDEIYDPNAIFVLAGWHEDRWVGLPGYTMSSQIVTGTVKPGYTALAIGKIGHPESREIIADALSYNSTLTGELSDAGKISSVDSTNFFNLFPNPITSNELTLHYKMDYVGAARIQLYDMLGKLILSQTILIDSGINNHIINTSGLSKGVYTLLFHDANNGSLTTPKKIVIQN